jgi:hypothetical protein
MWDELRKEPWIFDPSLTALGFFPHLIPNNLINNFSLQVDNKPKSDNKS